MEIISNVNLILIVLIKTVAYWELVKTSHAPSHFHLDTDACTITIANKIATVIRVFAYLRFLTEINVMTPSSAIQVAATIINAAFYVNLGKNANTMYLAYLRTAIKGEKFAMLLTQILPQLINHQPFRGIGYY